MRDVSNPTGSPHYQRVHDAKQQQWNCRQRRLRSANCWRVDIDITAHQVIRHVRDFDVRHVNTRQVMVVRMTDMRMQTQNPGSGQGQA
jgi:hypothetical protein